MVCSGRCVTRDTLSRMWHDEQLSLGPIRDQTIAVIGYGIQGAAQASNMRESGLKVVVGLTKGGRTWDVAPKATGCARAGISDTTFKEEVETDWFGEQADLCGGVDRLVRTAFETLVEAGYQPEIAYFECLHELKLIVDLIQKYGIAGMYRRVSETARYGGLTRGGRVIGTEVRKSMRRTLDE